MKVCMNVMCAKHGCQGHCKEDGIGIPYHQQGFSYIPSTPVVPFYQPTNQGWQCPGCGRCYSPNMVMCNYCGTTYTSGYISLTGTTVTNNVIGQCIMCRETLANCKCEKGE